MLLKDRNVRGEKQGINVHRSDDINKRDPDKKTKRKTGKRDQCKYRKMDKQKNIRKSFRSYNTI